MEITKIKHKVEKMVLSSKSREEVIGGIKDFKWLGKSSGELATVFVGFPCRGLGFRHT